MLYTSHHEMSGVEHCGAHLVCVDGIKRVHVVVQKCIVSQTRFNAGCSKPAGNARGLLAPWRPINLVVLRIDLVEQCMPVGYKWLGDVRDVRCWWSYETENKQLRKQEERVARIKVGTERSKN